MADGRDVAVWDNHAEECREQGRKPFEVNGGFLREQVEFCISAGAKTAIDIGCGPGYWINMLTGLEYTGIDQSPGMLKLASEVSPNANFIAGNARRLVEALGDNKFDVAFTASVLQHNRHYPDKQEIVQQIYNILAPRGFLICTENTFRNDNCPEYAKDPYHTDGYSFTPEGWNKFMVEAGFETLAFNGRSEYLYRKCE